MDGDLDGKHPSVTIAIAWGLYLVLLVALGVLLLRGDRTDLTDRRSDR